MKHSIKALCLALGLLCALGIGFLGIQAVPTHLTIMTGSMSPTIKPGAEVFVVPQTQYTKGDVITFRVDGKDVVTHRFEGYNPDGSLITKGDANRTIDHWDQPVTKNDVVGKVTMAIPHVGFMTQPSWWNWKIHQVSFWAALSCAFGGLVLVAYAFKEEEEKSDNKNQLAGSNPV